jgi:hypothetical protein
VLGGIDEGDNMRDDEETQFVKEAIEYYSGLDSVKFHRRIAELEAENGSLKFRLERALKATGYKEPMPDIHLRPVFEPFHGD